MAFTKINAAGIGSTETVTLDGLTVINDGSFGGNVSVGGTLTYEDVTNIDSVGLITARNGIVVGSGITLSKDGDGFFTGVITATSYSGIDLSDVTGATGDFSIADKIVHTGDTDTALRFPAGDTISFETNGSERARIDSSGRVGVNQSSFATSDTMFSVSETSGHCEIGIISKNDSGVVINMGDTDSYNQGRIKYDNSDNSLEFRTAGSERLRIDSNGNMGVNWAGHGSIPQLLSLRGNMYMRQGDVITWNNGDCQIGGVSGYHLLLQTYNNSTMKARLQVQGGQYSPIYARNRFDEFKPLMNTTGHVDHPDYSTNSKSNLSAGWYTIAVNGGNRATGRFIIIDRAGSRHQSFTFYASHHYGGAREQNAINVMHGGGRHSSNPIRALRIKANNTYDGAMLQVYLGDSSNAVMASLDGANMNTNGWIMKDWIADGTDPGSLNDWNSIQTGGGTSAYADLTQINGGGMSCDGNLIPGFDNSDCNLGTSSRRWVRVYAGDSSINTSDENLKQDITTLTTAEMNAAKRLSKLFVTYKWKKSVSEKGEKARTHTGIIAQRVKAEMVAAGLDPTKYSFYCEDNKYTMPDGTDVDLIDENVTDAEVVDDNHVPSYVQPPGSTKSTIYSICYTELLAFIAAYNEQRFTSIESRLAALESS